VSKVPSWSWLDSPSKERRGGGAADIRDGKLIKPMNYKGRLFVKQGGLYTLVTRPGRDFAGGGGPLRGPLGRRGVVIRSDPAKGSTPCALVQEGKEDIHLLIRIWEKIPESLLGKKGLDFWGPLPMNRFSHLNLEKEKKSGRPLLGLIIGEGKKC